MKEIIETIQLEYDKSNFLIDLARHTNGKLYIEILQTIQTKDEKGIQHQIKINPSVLSDIIEVLQNYLEIVPKHQLRTQQSLLKNDKEEIQGRYLKGVSMEDLAIQFDCPKNLIENVLRNRGIAIVSNKIPKPKRWFRRKRK